MKAKSCKDIYIEEIVKLSDKIDEDGKAFLRSLTPLQLERLLKCMSTNGKA